MPCSVSSYLANVCVLYGGVTVCCMCLPIGMILESVLSALSWCQLSCVSWTCSKNVLSKYKWYFTIKIEVVSGQKCTVVSQMVTGSLW